jgi:hypothetical protein
MFASPIFNRRFGAALFAAAAILPACLPAFAHETKCPKCKMDVVQDTPAQDNEVALRYGRKRIEYRSVACALAEAKTEYKGDLTILAPSETKNKPVVLSRAKGAWSVVPETAVFVGEKTTGHPACHLAQRAFTNRAAFDAHVRANANLLAGAKPLSLAQIVEVSK